MTITRTHVRTHTEITFANPYLRCGECGQPVPAWHNSDACGCDASSWNNPCGHNAEAISVCPSWGPIDGCCCQEFLGRVDHEVAAP